MAGRNRQRTRRRAVQATSGGGSGTSILLEDGSALLLEDGTSKLLLES